MMINQITGENQTKHNPNWTHIPDHSFRILMIVGSGSGKTNSLLNSIIYQPDNDNIYLYANGLYEPKYQLLITKRDDAGIKYCYDPKALMEYANAMDDVYNNIND